MASDERRTTASLAKGLRYLYAFICRLAGKDIDAAPPRPGTTVRSGSAAAVGQSTGTGVGGPSADTGTPLRLLLEKARGGLTPASAYTIVVSVYSRSIGPTARMRSAGPQVVRPSTCPPLADTPSQAWATVWDCCAQIQGGGAWKKAWSHRLPSSVSSSDGSVEWSHSVHPPLCKDSVILVEVIDLAQASSSAGVEGVVGACIVLPSWLPSSSSHSSTVTGLFSVPNPGWYLLAREGAAPSDARGIEILIHGGRQDSDDARAHARENVPPLPQVAAAQAVPALLPDAPRIMVRQHHHTVYCDRKRQVCTAEGAAREGNVLMAVCPTLELNNSGPAASGIRVLWYASCPASAIGQDAPHVPTLAPGAIMHGIADAAPDAYIDGHTQMLMVRVHKLDEGHTWRMPTLPGGRGIPQEDQEREPDEITAQILATLGANAGSHPDSPLYSPVAALRLLRSEALSACRAPLSWYCTLSDVGRSMAALVSVPGKGAALTHATMAIESAPPRIREAWIEGTPAVGCSLIAHCWYYGGAPGLCELTWVRVDAEGNRSEASPITFDPLAHYPDIDSADGKLDPRILRITASDIGCSYKVTIEPVRQDGVRGAPTASKPTADIVAS